MKKSEFSLSYTRPIPIGSVGRGKNKVFYWDKITTEGKVCTSYPPANVIVTGMESKKYLSKKIAIAIDKSRET